VAAPAKQRPWRSLAVVGLVIVGLYLGVFLGPAQTPALGLDLRGGTEVTLTAHPITGGSVTKSALNQAVAIIRNRANGLGVAGATVNTQGSDNIIVAIPGKGRDQVLNTIGQTALLRFRQVMSLSSGIPTPVTTTTPTPTPTGTKTSGHGTHHAASGTSGHKASSPTATATAKSSPKATSSQPATKPESITKKASPSASPTPTPTPTPASTTTPSPTSSTSSSVQSQPLPGSQSRIVTAPFAKSYENWNCLKHPNPTNGADNPDYYIIACEPSTGLKYLLAPAAVEGTAVTSASSGLDTTTGTQWQVNLKFNGSGGSQWYDVTKRAYEVTNGQQSQPGSCSPPKGCNAVAIVLDGVVQSAPTIQNDGIPGGSAQITGNFTQKSAGQLADVLKYGALPLKFAASDVQSVSATLGAAQLRGGLIAGIIGLALVSLFSLLYYRALGLVTIGSLAVSGLILYAVTTLLGASSIGYTLSLPGIAGFVVAVGITADSFVVYFERIRDEIREGRRLRSGVERAWPRARRTILSADTVSLLAAAILYWVSIGDVRGFAFTLGLSTLSDLFIVFMFTKPVITLLASRPAFDRGKAWTGVGRARAGVARDSDEQTAAALRAPQTREA
jgi:preprotein translocase subunit SecD